MVTPITDMKIGGPNYIAPLLLRLVFRYAGLRLGLMMQQQLALPCEAVLVREIEMLYVLLDDALVL
jgi:hypothetical protein